MREGWTYKKLGEVCEIICGQDYKKVESPYGKYPIYGTGGIMGYANEFKCPAYSVIVGRKGNINNPIYVEENFWNVDTAFGVVPSKVSLASKFFFYFCKNYDFTKHNVAVTIPSLRRIDLLKIPIPVPPLSEQQRIISELDLLSSIIEKKKAQLKGYDQLAQSIFYDMFGDLLEAIPTTTLKEVASYYIGLTYKPTDVSEKGTIVLRSSNIQNNILDFADTVKVNLNVGDNKIVKDGDILMCARNGSARLVGKVARIKNIEEKMSFGAFMTIIRSDYNDYLFHFFLSDFFRKQLSTSKTATINQITSKMLDNIKLNVPPLPLQQSFASKIEAIEHQKALIQQSITEAETLFNSRMDYWFS